MKTNDRPPLVKCQLARNTCITANPEVIPELGYVRVVHHTTGTVKYPFGSGFSSALRVSSSISEIPFNLIFAGWLI